MGTIKKIGFDNIFIILFFIVFPFGQIIRIGVIHPLDVIVAMGALVSIVYRYQKPEVLKKINLFLFIASFSWLLSLLVFKSPEVFYGLLYLVRLWIYFYFAVYVWHFSQKEHQNKQFLIQSLLLVTVVSGFFGWLQYFWFPNLGSFLEWGWDEHYLRLTGTFLDPTFLGIILVLGLIISLNRFIETGLKKYEYLYIFIFLTISLLFTYSRASYLAFFAGLLYIAFRKGLMSKIVYIIFAFAFIVLLLPTSQNNVLKFTRQFSVLQRIENYKETIQIFKTSPVFGVGYNNICLAKSEKSGYFNYKSHACSGSDSSLLFVLATTGVLGIIVFLYPFLLLLNSKNSTLLLESSFLSLFVHSMFSNSIFYSWVLGYMIVLISTALGNGKILGAKR